MSAKTLLHDERGGITVEAAFGIASLLTTLVFCIAAIVLAVEKIASVEAAYGAARLAARGDSRWEDTARQAAPSRAVIHREDQSTTVTITVELPPRAPLPLRLVTTAVAVTEPRYGA